LSETAHRSDRPEIAVLLSGGIDSMACADFYLSMDRPVCGIFVDYGQAATTREAAAATAVARHFAIPLLVITARGPRAKGDGEIPARNAFLACAAAMERPPSVLAIALGIHAGTSYADCSSAFVASAKGLLSLQSIPVDVVAPFLDWQKQEVIEYALKRRLPIELTYSCESGTLPPCGRCMSCLDRRVLDARA
jgi:7-cyano-7-deazaguanine synthase